MEDDYTIQTMTVRDVAKHLKVVEKTVYRLAQRGELPGFKVAGAWRFKRSDIEDWIDGQKRAVAEQAAKYETSPPSRKLNNQSEEASHTSRDQ